jgi:hypothetical protein
MSKLIVNCSNCNKELQKFPRDKRNKYHFCNRQCKNDWQKTQKISEETKKKISESIAGEKNGMFGKNHNTEIRLKISNESKKHFRENPELRYKCGNSRLPKEERTRIAKLSHKNRTKEYRKGFFLPEKTKNLIGQKSAEKFTIEYKKRIRKQLEDKGTLIPLDKKDEFLLYKDFANWKYRMLDLITDENEIKLLKDHGIFNCRTNKKGTVRDHKYSRFSGWKNGVFPELLRHPCNCEILLHGDNVRKKKGRHVDSDSQTLNELFENIKKYKNTWKEQELCIQLINDYEQGNRYNKKTYIEKYYEKY